MARALGAVLVAAASVGAAEVDAPASSGDSCESHRYDFDVGAVLLQARRELRLHVESTCGNPAWFYPVDECDDSSEGSDDGWGNRRRKYTPPPAPCETKGTFPWCDSAKTAEQRADLLVDQMNWTELAQQVSCDIFGGVPAVERLRINAYNYIRENDHGLLWNDVCPVPTVFPQVISMAASFNRTLWASIGEASAIETRYNYDAGKQNSLFTQTNFNIFIDPRWGRGQEVPGEDPYLSTAYARAWISGVQSPKGPGGVPLAGTSCKHFAAYSLEGAGGWPHPMRDSNRHNFDAVVTEQDLADTHLPMYRGCTESGAMGMMTAYNAVNGVPSCANGKLTNDLARGVWGFNGTVVTDCGAVSDLWLLRRYAATGKDAAEAALRGGTDVECGNTVKESATPEMADLMRVAVKRSFAVRFRLGEFDVRQPGHEAKVYDRASHASLAYEAAVQGTVLLKNSDGTLPLPLTGKVALAGPLKGATWEALGNYAAVKNNADWSDSPNVVSPLQGMQQCGLGSNLIVLDGGPYICSSTDEVVPGFAEYPQRPDAEAVVIVAGLYCQDPQLMDVDRRPEESGKCQSGCLESEGCDRPSLQLPQGQRQLIHRALGWGIPVVLVIIAGGPLDLSEFDDHDGVKAILWMGYPGQAAGTAMARILFGLDSPSGRLPHTFYRSRYLDAVNMKQMNLRADMRTGYPGRTYRFVHPHWVLYPFGYGLSYTTWKYERLGCGVEAPSAAEDADARAQAEATSAADFKPCHFSLKVSAVGEHRAEGKSSTSVLIFLAPPSHAVEGAPRKKLAKFDRVTGDTSELTFHFGAHDFMLANHAGTHELQHGTWKAEVGVPSELQAIVEVGARGCVVKPARSAPSH